MRGGGMAEELDSYPTVNETIRSFDDFVKQLDSAEHSIELYTGKSLEKFELSRYTNIRNKLLKDYPDYAKQAEEKKKKDRQDKEQAEVEDNRKRKEEKQRIDKENIENYGSLENMRRIKEEDAAGNAQGSWRMEF